MAKGWSNELPSPRPSPWRTNVCHLWLRAITVIIAVWFLTCHFDFVTKRTLPQWYDEQNTADGPRCPQIEPILPSKSTKKLDLMQEFLDTEIYRNQSIARLSGAVQIPTESFDDLGSVGEDPRWEIFYSFSAYLSKTFPLVHTNLHVEKVNTHALLYTWPGTDPTLKPTLLMAHQDVVPVPKSTVAQWTHPPFSGHFDGKFIWGRGASDCKNQLIGILEAVEALIEADFTPRRTLLLSFGFDEEISGREGAQSLAKFLGKRYGHHSISVIVDEGAANIESWGVNWAIPGVAEKGGLDVDVTVRMPGGHSSIPPQHNGIGVASELIALIEANPYEPLLVDENPYLALLYCGAVHAPDFPPTLKKLLHKRSTQSHTCSKKDKLAIEAAKAGPAIKYLFTTSQAVDVINGGAKTNALPERTQFTVNHRINVGSTSKVVFNHITVLAHQVATKYNLTLYPFNGTETPNSITLSAHETLLEPAPITPTAQFSPFGVLSGTTRALYGRGLLVAPGIMTGNTDTRYYWDLSESIFRYSPGWDREQKGMGSIHTVDERIGLRAHLDVVKWIWTFVRNMDEAELE